MHDAFVQEAPAEVEPIQPGMEVDHYRILRLIGRGGMGEVFLARDTRLGRRVALKLIAASAPRDTEGAARFLREARTTALFSHPNIVTIYDVGEVCGRPYVALEYLEGESLRERLDAERLTAPAAARAMLSVAEAVAEAHRHGVLHRDLKPENVFLPRDGRVRVLDFGLAKAMHGEPAEPQEQAAVSEHLGFESQAHGVRGTPMYMAPEQWRLEPCTPATDVWAIGVMLFELLCGKRPYETRYGFALGVKVSSAEPAPELPADCAAPEALRTLVSECLRKEASQRPSIERVVEALHAAVHPSAARAAGSAPFRGLLAFTERQASMFFGRESETAALIERLREHATLAVVGASGAGKSSLVQAGVIPRLREQGAWHVLVMRPGRDPFGALAFRVLGAGSLQTPSASRASGGAGPSPAREGEAVETLARELRQQPRALALKLQTIAERDKCSVLLCVDQLEELVGLVPDDPVRQAFMTAICTAAEDREAPVRVIMTLRDDFLGRLALVPEAREALSHVTVLRPPDEQALREIVSKSFEAGGYRFEDESLVAEMVRSVKGESASLPLVQFASTLLWERRDKERRCITRAAYDEIGGVGGALAHHADALLDAASERHVEVARQMLLRMVGGGGTRRVLTRKELLDGLPEESAEVLARLVEGRLITSRRRAAGGDLVELAHEALVQRWDRLRRWIEGAREELSLLEDIDVAAKLWDKRGRGTGDLWVGDGLRDATRRLAGTLEPLSGLGKDFIEQSRRADARLRSRRRLLTGSLFAGAGLITASALLVALALNHKESQVREQRNIAEQQRLEAEKRRADALLDSALASMDKGEPVEARAKLRTALTLADSPRARGILWRFARNPLVWAAPADLETVVIASSPSLDSFAAPQFPGTVLLFEPRTLESRRLRGFGETPTGFCLSTDGRMAAWADSGGALHIVDATSGVVKTTISSPAAIAVNPAFSPDGRRVAYASTRVERGREQYALSIADTDGGRIAFTLSELRAKPARIQYSPDGRYLAADGADAITRVWDSATGAQVAMREGSLLAGFASAGASYELVTAGKDGVIRFRDVRTFAELRLLKTDAGIRVARVHPDGQRIAVAGEDGELKVIGGSPGAQRTLPARRAHTLAFSKDGRYLGTATDDGKVEVWDLETPVLPGVPGPADWLTAVAASGSADLVASADSSGALWLWNGESGTPIHTYHGHKGPVHWLALTSDGATLVSGGTDRTVRVWDVLRRRPDVELRHDEDVTAMAVSTDDRLIATGAKDGALRIWSLDTRQLRQVIPPGAGAAPSTALAFTPDGKSLYAALGDSTLSVVDLATGRRRDTGQTLICKHSRCLDVSGNGVVAAAGESNDLRLLEPGSQAWRRLTAPVTVAHLSLSADGSMLAISGDSRYLLDLRSSGPTGKLRSVQSFGDTVLRGGRVIGGGTFSPVVWEAPSGRSVWRTAMVFADPPVSYTQSGWRSLVDGSLSPPEASQWRNAVEENARLGLSSRDGQLLCILTRDGHLEVWDRKADRVVTRTPSDSEVVEAMDDACLIPQEDESGPASVTLYHRAGGKQVIARDTHAYDVNGTELYVDRKGALAVLDSRGNTIASYPLNGAFNAASRDREAVAVGYRDGRVEVRSLHDGTVSAPVQMERPGGAFLLSQLRFGPAGTLIASYGNGRVIVWDHKTGVLLLEAGTSGEALETYAVGERVVTATEIGHSVVLDLGLLQRPYCDLLGSVWDSVPVVWSDGAAVPQGRPAGHPCSEP